MRFSQLDKLELDRRADSIAESYASADSPQALVHLIGEIDLEVATIDADLKHFVALKLKKLQHDTNAVEWWRSSKLSGTISTSNELSTLFQLANDLGSSLTLKIKTIDREIGIVNQALEHVRNVQFLRNTIRQIHYAIEKEDWEFAAKCIYQLNKTIQPELMTGLFAQAVVPCTEVPDLPQVVIERWLLQLKEKFKDLFSKAAAARNAKDLTRYFQLFPLISQQEEGLACYSKFICQIIRETSKGLLSSVLNKSDSIKPGTFAFLTQQFLESVCVMLSQHSPLIKRHYVESYPTALTHVFTSVEHEVDAQMGTILDTFYDLRRIEKMFQDIDIASAPSDQQAGTADDDILLVEVGNVCQELTALLRQWTQYCKFTTLNYTDSARDPLELPVVFAHSPVTIKIHKTFAKIADTLCAFYFGHSLRKSIATEELPPMDDYLLASSPAHPDPCPVLSVIEDLTIVLNTALGNALDTGHLPSVKKFISQAFKVVQDDFVNEFLIRRLNENQPRYNQTLQLVNPQSALEAASLRSATPEIHQTQDQGIRFFKGASSALGNVVGQGSAAAAAAAASSTLIASGLQGGALQNSVRLINFVIYLNTAASAQEYFEKIVSKAYSEGNLQLAFPFGRDATIVEGVLKTEFLQPFVTMTSKIISDLLVNLYNQAIKNKVVSIIHDFLPETSSEWYQIHPSVGLNDNTRLSKATAAWESLMRPYKQTFHNANAYKKFLRLMVINVATILEKRILSVLKKYGINDMGSVKLEMDLLYFINSVCEDSYQLREKFVRTTQVVLLVGMDDEEYQESSHHANQRNSYAENGEAESKSSEFIGINWVLTPQERNAIRLYRV